MRRNAPLGTAHALFICFLVYVVSVPVIAAGEYYQPDDLDYPLGGFHSGAVDPEELGWLLTENDNGSPVSSIVDGDINAWQIASDERWTYYREDTPPELDDSWTLITRFRVPDNSTALSYSVVAGIDYGYTGVTGSVSDRYIFAAGSDANGGTLLRFQSTDLAEDGNGRSYTVGGKQNATQYVTVALVYDGVDMDVYINEVKAFSDVPSIAGPAHNRVQFGDGQTSGGEVVSDWTEVLYSVGPQACRDGIDNDGDGFADYVDIDNDGVADSNSDPDCSDPNDPTEGDSNRTMASWGSNSTNQTRGTLGGTAILEVASGGGHSVALKANGQLVAWGADDENQATPPPGTNFVAVAAGGRHSLALRSNGDVIGWGDNSHGQAEPTADPNQNFKAISAGTNHSLGLRDDGGVHHWGLNNDGLWLPPEGSFQSIDAGHDYSLGIRDNGSIECWGDDSMCLVNPPPSGNDFVAVAAGHTHALALRQDGSIVGWGTDSAGEATPPIDKNYIAIAAGDGYSLALTRDGTLAQWGSGLVGRPVGDDFVAVTAGVAHASVIRGVPDAETPLAVCSEATLTPGATSAYEAFNRFSFNAAIACFNAVTSGEVAINFSNESSTSLIIPFDSFPPFPVNNESNALLVVEGNGFFIREISSPSELSDPSYRFMTIDAGVVEVRNLTFVGGLAVSGGAFYNSGTLVVRNVALQDNQADGGGAIVNASGASLTVLNTTLSNNSASSGGAIENSGILSVVNSTLSGNSSNLSGSALLNASGASATFYNSTLFGNPAGVMSDQPSGAINNTGELTLRNTIIDNEQAMGVSCLDFSEGELIADSHNLVTDGCGSATQTTSNLIGLGLLLDNGVSIQTHALLPGSVAINAADLATCNGDLVNGLDQRGLSRAANSTCDIGAFESQGPIIEIEQATTAAENQPIAIDLDAELDGSNSADEGMSYAFSAVGGGGADNTLFSLDPNTGIVSFNALPDFERPGGVATDNTYSIQVTVSDPYGNSQVVSVQITVTDDLSDNCSPDLHSRKISNLNTWHLLTLPCELPAGAEFADLFGEQRLLDDEWSAFTYDASRPGYERITATSPAPAAGTGFWLISTAPFEFVVPAGSQKVAMVTADACAGGNCYRQTIDHQTNWNLLGNPATENLRYEQMLVSNESTSCIAESSDACSVANPDDMGVSSSMFVYNSFAGVYRSVDTSVQQVVKPWDGYWTMFSYDGELDSPWQLYSKDYPSQFVFVTDESYTGNLGGLAGADEICQQAAEDAGYPGDYIAWLSAGSLPIGGRSAPLTSFSNPESPYVRTDGALIADGWDDLVSINSGNTGSYIYNPVEITPSLTGAANALVWTNTSVEGKALLTLDCNAWNSIELEEGDSRIVVGSTSQTDKTWTLHSSSRDCDSEARLYCFGQ